MADDAGDAAAYAERGFVVIRDFASEAEVRKLKESMAKQVEAWNPTAEELAVFTTSEEQRHAHSKLFFESANTVEFFVEKDALGEDAPVLVVPKEHAINKAGHAIHEVNDAFREWAGSKRVRDVCMKLAKLEVPVAVQSMYIFKPPKIGGEVVPHQDSTFLYTTPRPTCVGLWLALDDATEENGCIYASPGSHVHGIKRRFVRAPGDDASDTPAMVFEDDESKANIPGWTEAEMVPLPMRAGDLLVLDGACVHMSKRNTSSVPRHSAQLHVVEGSGWVTAPTCGSSGVRWDARNWLQRAAGVPFLPL